jgi:glycosyltransferase involved in cell wall biosynthesis
LPVIASDVGQLGEDVTTHSLGPTFTPDDPGSLHQAIVSFFDLTEAEIAATKTNFNRFAAELPWQEVANRYIALYSKNSLKIA